MIETTLCYIEQNGCYLLLHRIKKKNDVNRDKWIGIGGKFLEGEAAEPCARREILEETGLFAKSLEYRGVVDFHAAGWPDERMHLFWTDSFEGDLKECDEGVLEWVDKTFIKNLPQWEGDKIFLKLLDEPIPFFSLKLEYKGEDLVLAVLNGERIK